MNGNKKVSSRIARSNAHASVVIAVVHVHVYLNLYDDDDDYDMDYDYYDNDDEKEEAEKEGEEGRREVLSLLKNFRMSFQCCYRHNWEICISVACHCMTILIARAENRKPWVVSSTITIKC